MKMTEQEMEERRKQQEELDRLDAVKKLKLCLGVGVAAVVVLLASCLMKAEVATLISGAVIALMIGVSVNLYFRTKKPKE